MAGTDLEAVQNKLLADKALKVMGSALKLYKIIRLLQSNGKRVICTASTQKMEHEGPAPSSASAGAHTGLQT